MNYTTDYKDIIKEKPFSFRSMAREIALTGLVFGSKFQNVDKILKKPRVQFLYVHHVFDDERQNFELLIKELIKNYEFISYSDAVEKITSNSIDRPYISISSDDNFKNNLNAVEILNRYDIKACFFINPDTMGLKDAHTIRKFCKSRLNFPPTEFLDWNDVNSLMKNGHEIGSHTMGHINIADTEYTVVEENLNISREIIVAKCGKAEHFAYPYGRFFHFNLPSFQLVFDAGFKTCASAERGCHINDQPIPHENLFLRRDHILCNWDLDHIKYFLLNNSRNAAVENNFAPYKK